MSTYNRIGLKGFERYEEGFANAALTPGHAIEVMSTGKLRKQATRGADTQIAFAIENSLLGTNIDTAFAADDLVPYILPKKGDEVYAFLTPGTNYVKGDRLDLTGDGTLEKVSSTYKAVAVLMENLDLSASGSVATRAPVRII